MAVYVTTVGAPPVYSGVPSSVRETTQASPPAGQVISVLMPLASWTVRFSPAGMVPAIRV